MKLRELYKKEYNPKEQIKVLLAFKALEPYAQEVADLVKYSKVDTKGMGKDFT